MEQVHWSDYTWRIVSVRMQFGLARVALGSLSKPEIMRVFLDQTLPPFLEGAVIPKEVKPERLAGELEKFLLRLDQNELVLTVALFETFMRDIHRAVLRQTPTLLREDRMIPLGRLVANGSEVVIEKEIEREVLAMDRASFQDRARHFDERLLISWGPSEIVDVLERMINLRNRILHEAPDEPVPQEVLTNLAGITLVVSGFACQAVADHYPSAMTEQDRESLSGRPFDTLSDYVSRVKQHARTPCDGV